MSGRYVLFFSLLVFCSRPFKGFVCEDEGLRPVGVDRMSSFQPSPLQARRGRRRRLSVYRRRGWMMWRWRRMGNVVRRGRMVVELDGAETI